MDILLVASHAPQRWSLADALGVEPDDALPPAEGFARLVHPIGCTARAVVLVLGTPDELHVLERLVGRRGTPPLVVLATSRRHADLARAAGVAAVVDGDGLELADHAVALRSRVVAIGRGDERARATA